jgi:hypothetical protein
MNPEMPEAPVSALAGVAKRARDKEGLAKAQSWEELVLLVADDGLSDWQLYRLLSWLASGPGEEGAEQDRLATMIYGKLARGGGAPVTVPELGTRFGDWPAFVETLSGADLGGLAATLDNAPSQAGRQARRFVEARRRELAFGLDSRMLRGHARFGLELQDLDSMVAQLPGLGPAETLGPLVQTLPTVHCGAARLWQLTGDGSDLEFITAATNNQLELRTAMAELLDVYERIAVAGPGTYRAGDTCVRRASRPSTAGDRPLARGRGSAVARSRSTTSTSRSIG